LLPDFDRDSMTTAAATARQVGDANHAFTLTLAPATLSGWMDPADLERDAPLQCRVFRDETELSAPGLGVRLDQRRIDWHATAGSITLVAGHPCLHGERATAEQIDGLLARSGDPWSGLGGRFAIVRLDLDSGEVALATDRFAVWPLVWSREGPRILFSDRADRVPLAQAPTVDAQALFDYAYFHVIPAPRTIFSGVHRVEPATVIRLSAIAAAPRATWRPAFARRSGRADRSLQARFRQTVREAVVRESGLASVGCFLSGGTDSSTIAGMLAREHGTARTFSIGFDVDGYDEMEYARIAAAHFHTEHHEYYVSPDDLVRAVPAVAREFDQPFGNSSAVPAYYCALMARDHGVERLLAGDGGDELFGGNQRYAKQKVFEAYQRIPHAVRAGVLEPLLANRFAHRIPGIRKAASYIEQARLPMPARMETYNLLERFGPANVFAAGFLERIDAEAPARLQADIYARGSDASFIDRILAYDWRFTLADNDLPKVTGAAHLAGIDVRFPLLDDGLVDLSVELAPADKVRGTHLRAFFKQALADFLPLQILRKKKHGFGLPVGPWLVTNPPFRAQAHEALVRLAERGLVRHALVEDLLSRRLEEHPGYYGQMVWVLMTLEVWLAAHSPAWTAR
jgi:asparagine synthase (glutamine-hydrolysing)